MITLSAAQISALESDNFSYAHLIQIPGPVYLTNHGSDIVEGGYTYLSSGLVGNLQPATQQASISLNTYKIELSNVDQTITNAYMSQNYRGFDAVVSLVLIDTNGDVINDPYIIFKGTLDNLQIEESASKAKLTLSLTSHWASFNATNTRYTTDHSQNEYHSGDSFFKWAYRERSNLGWGKE